MKRQVLLFVVMFCHHTIAQSPRKVGDGDSIPQDGFKTFAELNSWAASSSFGGGFAKELSLSGKKLFFSDRMFTSGVPTSELIFYALNAKGEIRPFIIVPVQAWKEFRVKAEGDEIVVRTYVKTTKSWSIALRIAPYMLPNLLQ